MEVKVICTFVIFYAVLQLCCARIHKLEIKNDARRYIALSTFGFFKGGMLDVKLHNFHATPFDDRDMFGFSLDRTLSDAMNPYLDSHQDGCLLQQVQGNSNDGRTETGNEPGSVIYFILDFQKKRLKISCSHNGQSMSDLHSIQIYQNASEVTPFRPKRGSLVSQYSGSSGSDLVGQHRRRRNVPAQEVKGSSSVKRSSTESSGCAEFVNVHLPMNVTETSEGKFFNANFVVYVASENNEGLYNLYFHNCPNYKDGKNVALAFTMEIEENNNGNFLSAGEMPLPALYFMMALLFFLSGCFWVFILSKSKHPVYKIHYLMAVLVYLKSLSLMFHGVNYHFIQTKGEHIATWAILYYVAHLLKGAVLFITIVLVGTGWTFIKHILSEKDKKIFMIVIPLQVLANVAEIIIEESEEGAVEHGTWRDVFILVDLLTIRDILEESHKQGTRAITRSPKPSHFLCSAICSPIFTCSRSIRHLQEASHTDGKAAINLRKLKLFRHFYIMIVCYIYFTRIIVYLLKITVPFQYEWLDEMFREMATYVFFVLTGYKFRPASANPYFQINVDDDDEEEIDVVVSQSGLTEGLSKIARTTKVAQDEMSDEEKDNLLAKRESSHEYD
ncbi:Protein GPR107 [Blattella germanica]|nr:Protein GPR107 [Blattella germanica]